MAEYHLERLEVFEGDVLDADFLPTALRGVDCVVFCAATPVLPRPPSIFTNPFAPQRKRFEGSVAEDGVERLAFALRSELARQSASQGRPPTRFALLSAAQTPRFSSDGDDQRRGEAKLKIFGRLGARF